MLPAFEDLPSWKSLFTAALSGSQIPLVSDQISQINRPSFGISKSCPNPSLSCQNGGGSVSDTCCTNYPGGQFALTQFWNSDPHAGPPGYLGPNNTWTIHGLWPDHCDGRFDSVCDCERSGDCSYSNHKCSHSHHVTRNTRVSRASWRSLGRRNCWSTWGSIGRGSMVMSICGSMSGQSMALV